MVDGIDNHFRLNYVLEIFNRSDELHLCFLHLLFSSDDEDGLLIGVVLARERDAGAGRFSNLENNPVLTSRKQLQFRRKHFRSANTHSPDVCAVFPDQELVVLRLGLDFSSMNFVLFVFRTL